MNKTSKLFQVLACLEDKERLEQNWNVLLKKWGYNEDCDNLLLNWGKYDSWVEGGMIKSYLSELKKDNEIYKKEYDRACKELYEKGFYIKQISRVEETENGFFVTRGTVRRYDDEN